MDGHRLQNHLEEIDEFVSHYLDAATAVKPEILMGGQVDVEEMLKYGGFPPSDPRSRSGAALLAIARKLKDQGGTAQLAQVLDNYRHKYGANRAATLNARWHYLTEQ